MGGAHQIRDVGVGRHAVTHFAQRSQVGHPQRNLVDHAECQVSGAACGQHDLVMFGWVTTQEHQLNWTQVATVRLKKAHDVFVKTRHSFQIAYIKPHVTERQRVALTEWLGHGLLLILKNLMNFIQNNL